MLKEKKTAYILAGFGNQTPFNSLSKAFLQKKLSVFQKVFQKKQENLSVQKILPPDENLFLEKLKEELQSNLRICVYTFYLNLSSSHQKFLDTIHSLDVDQWKIFPTFPQFSYEFSGSIAAFFSKHLSRKLLNKMRWIKSYATHDRFIKSWQKNIKAFLSFQNLKEENTIFLFSCTGIEQKWIEHQDLYETESENCARAILKAFPFALGKLAYSDPFASKKQVLEPTLSQVCQTIDTWGSNRKHVVFVPISSIYDEKDQNPAEKSYLELLQKKGYDSYLCPSLNLDPFWVSSIFDILQDNQLTNNQMLLFPQAALSYA